MSNQHSMIDDHRNMFMLSKNLSQFQLMNLQAWPQVFFENYKNAKIEYNFIDKDENFYSGEVTFNIDLDGELKEDASCLHLEAATKLMFWSDTQVNILINGEKWNKK
jgi:hypothetical protein